MKKVLFVFLFSPFLLLAQSYAIKQLGIQEGLSNNHVVSIAQDKKGFLWFATEEGLNKFDGIHFTSYYKEAIPEKQTITANELNCLLDDPTDSILWIGTQRVGLNAYNYANETFTAYIHSEDQGSLITNDITKIVAADDRGLWVCTYWKGIDYLDKKTGKFKHYNTETVSGLASDQIWSVADGGNGLLYIGHVNNGFSVLSIKDMKSKNFSYDPLKSKSLPGNEVMCVYKDKNGNIWVGTNRGLALFNPEEENFISFNDKAQNLSHRIYDIKQLDNNKLWIAMEFGGIAILDLSQPLFHSSDQVHLSIIREGEKGHDLSNSSIRCIFQDSFNNIWTGSWGGGINFVRREPLLFNSYTGLPSPVLSANNLTGKIVSAICMDKTGNLWVGTDRGEIKVFNKGKQISAYTVDSDHLNGNSIQTALCDSKGGLWFGLFYGGIIYYDQTGKYCHQLLPPEKSHADVRSFFEDGEGNIWVGTSEGVYIMDLEKKQIKEHYDLQNNLVRCILKDSKGQTWVGFFGGGLVLYDRQFKKIRLFYIKNGFPSNTINALYEDSRKRLWVATGEGLVCFPSLTDSGYEVYQRESGLTNTHIQAIGEDIHGNIWVSTNKGISCRIKNKDIFHNYDHHDNLPSGSFSRGCITYGQDGNFYFGSINGLCYFDPEYVLKERKSPPALITNIEITDPLNKPRNKQNIIALDGQHSIDLNYTENSFSIRFNVRNYALADEVEYIYMLKGLEDSWYILTNPNNVTFRNLPPGKYQFLVKTRMRNQEWSDDVTSLNIRISPPIWLTWWAKLAYASLAFSILFSIIYIYQKRLKAEALYKLEKQSYEQEQELNNERLRFYTNITHELRTPLTLILGPLEDLQANNSLSGKDAQKISVIHRSAIRLLNLINQILEFRKTETQNKKLCVSCDNLSGLIYEVGLKYKELNRNPEVEICLEIEDETIQVYFDKEVLIIILDNLISNALKYTERGNVSIGIRQTKQAEINRIEIWVSDTGYGIKPESLPYIFDRYYQEGGKHQASGTGIGLSLVKSLVVLHEGEIHVTSTPNSGSTFCLSLLANNTYPNALHADSMNEEETAQEQKLDSVTPTSDKPILLVVEDNPDICEYIAESFSDSFDVKTESNGEQGLESALKYIPDIIVSDIMMPVMDGNEMCRKLKKDLRTSHIPIILLTAKDSLKDKEEGYLVGADSYLTKPFSASLLRSRIDNLLQSRRDLAKYFSNNASFKAKSTVITESLNKLDKEFIEKIDLLIEDRLSSDKIDIGYLSDKMCMSSSTLYRKMKALTGLSTNEYVRKIRMKVAERLLLEGKDNISEIAFKVGINNLFYFRQCFKEAFGCIPSEYLKKLKEGAPPNNTSE